METSVKRKVTEEGSSTGLRFSPSKSLLSSSVEWSGAQKIFLRLLHSFFRLFVPPSLARYAATTTHIHIYDMLMT